MKILIVSDTHRKNQNFFNVVRKQSPDMVIHCGDAEGCEDDLAQAAGCPLMIVLGNNDFFSQLPREDIFQIGTYPVFLTHGHTYHVGMGIEPLKNAAIDRGTAIAMYGHTHRPLIDQTGSVTIINPGSLSQPRQENHKPSFIMMDIDRFGLAHFALNYL